MVSNLRQKSNFCIMHNFSFATQLLICNTTNFLFATQLCFNVCNTTLFATQLVTFATQLFFCNITLFLQHNFFFPTAIHYYCVLPAQIGYDICNTVYNKTG